MSVGNRTRLQLGHVQSENLWCVTCLDAVAFALPRVACDDREIRTSDGQDSAAILGVGIELPFLRVGVRTVGHCVLQRAG